MTKIQIKFYEMITRQMVDFNSIFHSSLIKQKIKQIKEDDLKYLYDNIATNKDNIGKKGYIDYIKFVHYADKLIKQYNNIQIDKYDNKVEELYKKRDKIIYTLEYLSDNNLAKRNKLIEDFASKKIIFSENEKNIFDSVDFFIIEKIGFYQFCDENTQYKIKEQINKYYQEYLAKTKAISIVK
jgi:hypothetical protein